MDSLSIARAAKKCAPILANAPTQQKNAALLRMAELLDAHRAELVAANQVDVTAAKDANSIRSDKLKHVKKTNRNYRTETRNANSDRKLFNRCSPQRV